MGWVWIVGGTYVLLSQNLGEKCTYNYIGVFVRIGLVGRFWTLVKG